MTQVIEKISHGSSGGHVFASGAVIDTDFEDKFIKAAVEVLENVSMEERI